MRTIIKHANRRLYDTSEGRAITLLRLSEIVVSGEVVRVLDRATAEDITAITLLQALLERLKRRRADESSAGEVERVVAAVRGAMVGESDDAVQGDAIGDGISG